MSIVKLNNRGVRSATTFGSISALGEMRFIKKQTASSSSTISFVDGTSDVVLDDTYKEYIFTLNNIHPADHSTSQYIMFQGSIDSGSNYNVTMTTTYFRAEHYENDSASNLGYVGGADQAQGTSFQRISDPIGNENDECGCAILHLFNPSSTTFVKHFVVNAQIAEYGDRSINTYCAGYFNTTSAIDAVQFKMNSGNMDAGDICLYGIN